MLKIKKFYNYIKENKDKQVDIGDLLLKYNEIFLMIPLFAFVVAPIYYLVAEIPFNLNDPFNGFFNYSYTITYVIYLSVIAGPVALAIYFRKLKKDGKKFFIKEYIPMLFFVAVCVLIVISSCVNGFTSKVLLGDSYRNESIFSFLVYFISMYFCGTLIQKEKSKKIILETFLISNFLINVVELFHYYIKPLDYFEHTGHVEPSAIFYQCNHYGYFLMLAIMISAGIFSLSKSIKEKAAAGFMLALNTFILSVNTTFGCFLACLIGMFFLVIVSSIIERKINIFSILAFAAFMIITFLTGLKYHSFLQELGMFFSDIKSVMGSVNESVVSIDGSEVEISAADSAGTGRWGLWRYTIGYIQEKPFLGWGIEGISDMLREASNGLNNRPHNEYLQYAAFFGIPATVLYIIGIAVHFVKAFRNRHSFNVTSAICLVAAFTYLISAIFGNTMFYTTPYLFIFMGLATKESDIC